MIEAIAQLYIDAGFTVVPRAPLKMDDTGEVLDQFITMDIWHKSSEMVSRYVMLRSELNTLPFEIFVEQAKYNIYRMNKAIEEKARANQP